MKGRDLRLHAEPSHRGKGWSLALCKLAAVVGASAGLEGRQYQWKPGAIVSHGGKNLKIIWEGI